MESTYDNKHASICSTTIRSSGLHTMNRIQSVERRDINSENYIVLLKHLEVVEKRLMKTKNKLMKTICKLYKLGFDLIPPPSYSPNRILATFCRFSELKEMFVVKKYGHSDKVMPRLFKTVTI